MQEQTKSWHFARPALAEKYLDLFKIGLTSARGLFARRRMGKTEFLKKDFMPAAQARGYITVYVNLWELEIDPAAAIVSEIYQAIEPKGFSKIWAKLKLPIKKIKASGKISGIGEGSVETSLEDTKRTTGTLLMEAMRTFDKTAFNLMLIIDEAQVLAYDQNSHFAHALRAALDVRKERIKVIFAGSSETTLRRMFGVSSEPFYNWAPLEPFELLDQKFVEAMVERVNAISKYPLLLKDAVIAFDGLKKTPEFFRRYIEYYLSNPFEGADAALSITKNKVFNDESFKRQWDTSLPADKAMLAIIAEGNTDLYAKTTMERLGAKLGLAHAINKSTVNNALARLAKKNIITKMEYGIYQFEDEAFADWVRCQ
jgi:hypothetical protein